MTLVGRIATDSRLFSLYVILMPVVAVAIVNISIALLQVLFTKLRQRRLGASTHDHSNADVHISDFDDLIPYLWPALLQICIALFQIVAVFAFAQGPRLSAAVNHIIKSLEACVNKYLNDTLKDGADAVFGKAFQNVKEEADAFFPKFESLFEKLQELQQAPMN